MKIINAKYADEKQDAILCKVDGETKRVPVDEGNRLYSQIILENMKIAPYAPPAPTSKEVKQEAMRRILARYPEWKQRNMTARSLELLRKGEGNWSKADKTDAALIDAAWAWINQVRQASDKLALTLPVDYIAGKWWPK